MVDNNAGFRKLVDLRNKFLLNQINFNEFLHEGEIILYNYIGANNVRLAGGRGPYCYSTIFRRLLSDELGETHYLKNLRIDLTY